MTPPHIRWLQFVTQELPNVIICDGIPTTLISGTYDSCGKTIKRHLTNGNPLWVQLNAHYTSKHTGCAFSNLQSIIQHINSLFPVDFYASALGTGGIMFSGCPSVRPSVRPSARSLKYPFFTCTWVRWSIRPTVTILRHVRPSVQTGFRAFAGERIEGMVWNFACSCILTTYITS